MMVILLHYRECVFSSTFILHDHLIVLIHKIFHKIIQHHHETANLKKFPPTQQANERQTNIGLSHSFFFIHIMYDFQQFQHCCHTVCSHILKRRERERVEMTDKSVLEALDLIRDQKARLLRFELGMCVEEDDVKLKEVNHEILRTLETTSSSSDTKSKKKKKKSNKKDKVQKEIQTYTKDVKEMQRKLSELVTKLRLLRAYLS